MGASLVDIPFVHLIQTPMGYYVYDVNRNEVVCITKNAYCVLADWVGKKIDENRAFSLAPELLRLNAKGYLSANRPKEIAHGMAQFLPEKLKTGVQQLTLQVTQNCNFRCRYCPYSNFETDAQRSHTNEKMTLDTALCAIDFYFDHSRGVAAPLVSFYGGEPLLEFPLIKEVVKYSKKKFEGRKLRFNITTNGSILTDEVVEFFLANDFDVTISIDGPREIHDKNRRLADCKTGTFDMVVMNLQQAINKHPEFQEKMMINMVVDPKNDVDCSKALFVEYDVFNRDRTMASVVNTHYVAEDFMATQDFLTKDNYNQFIALFSKFRDVDPEYIPPLNKVRLNTFESNLMRMKPLEKLPDTIAPGGPCVPGILRLFVDVKGRFFPCERCSETSDIMNIGDLGTGFDVERCLRLLNVAQLAPNECKNCWAQLRCNVCAAQIEEGDHFSIEKKHQCCRGVMQQADDFLRDKIAMYEIGLIERRRKAK